jgi:hypothetical protein
MHNSNCNLSAIASSSGEKCVCVGVCVWGMGGWLWGKNGQITQTPFYARSPPTLPQLTLMVYE